MRKCSRMGERIWDGAREVPPGSGRVRKGESLREGYTRGTMWVGESSCRSGIAREAQSGLERVYWDAQVASVAEVQKIWGRVQVWERYPSNSEGYK